MILLNLMKSFNNKPLLVKSSIFYLILWVIAIVVFFVTAFLGNKGSENIYTDALLVIFLLGVAFFGLAIFNGFAEILLKHIILPIFKNRTIQKAIGFFVIVGLVFEVLATGAAIYFVRSQTIQNVGVQGQGGVSQMFKYVSPYESINKEIYKSEVVAKVNAERQKLNLKPLGENPVLTKSAEQKLQYMIDNNYWAHTAPDGTEPWDFITTNGYQYFFSGENLGRDFVDTDSLITAWMNSPEHKKNILDGNYDETGVAVSHTSLGGLETFLVVQMFGKKLPPPPVIPSRTGRTIPYHEWCGNKEITIYENELITKKSSDGNTYTMTQGDWDCYENFLKTKSQ